MRKEILLDLLRIYVKGVDEIKVVEGFLCNYLEKFVDVDIYEVFFGGNNNVFVIFEVELGIYMYSYIMCRRNVVLDFRKL